MQPTVINRLRARLRRIGCTHISIILISNHHCNLRFYYQGIFYNRILLPAQYDSYPTITYNF